ncbi:GspE/PulE family protein [Chromobacterium sp. IIBBL 290-4]|uniref:GspE/PulE family protein n=1 Tax=Chromobacterium sp. IIBBL 290-4 TaxID=2953890 RepID=UPI0020B8FA7B|nr:GspE/PulE family protein [Chromobacterium sp. IIBBL 290-4]UTH74247.1 GspE/PulE family protein [Chromobacterium sp. IIBBL 290-4]
MELALNGKSVESQGGATRIPAGLTRFISTGRPDAEAVAILNHLLDEAADLPASDIHLESEENGVRVRLRQFGKLRTVMTVNEHVGENMLMKVRATSRVSITDRETPQDGRIAFFAAGRRVDVRVSVVPTILGDSIVMRLLDSRNSHFSLSRLRMTETCEKALKDIINKPEGLFLMVGPTGSGKSTTLYSIVNELNRDDTKIITFEDPVESLLPGVQQFDAGGGRTSFAKGLRAALRHDPDVILVGEIRDAETAGIAMQAANTGHLVLSTLHTNGAVQTLTRLLDLGVDAATLGVSFLGVIAQRLAPLACPHCLESGTPTGEMRSWLREVGASSEANYALAAPGCERCDGRGSIGRVPVMEMIVNSKSVRRALERGDRQAIEEAAGLQPQFEQLVAAGLRFAREGLVTLSEVRRLTSDD